VKLLQAMLPQAKRLAVISNQGPHWSRSSPGFKPPWRLPGSRLVRVDQVTIFDQFKSRVAAYPGIFALA
jgi:hypothetical protein